MGLLNDLMRETAEKLEAQKKPTPPEPKVRYDRETMKLAATAPATSPMHARLQAMILQLLEDTPTTMSMLEEEDLSNGAPEKIRIPPSALTRFTEGYLIRLPGKQWTVDQRSATMAGLRFAIARWLVYHRLTDCVDKQRM